MGCGEFRIPRADAHRAVPPVLGRRGHDASQRSTWARSAWSAEKLGINVAPARNVTVRLTWFDNRISNPVSNVTLTATPAQKQNLGATRVWGIQSDVEYRLGSFWRLSGAYLYDQAKVTDGGAANAALVGKFLPQVPTHRGSLQVAYSNPKYVNVALGVQFIGAQFNDDLNVNFIPVATLTDAGYDASTPPGLPGYTVVDLMASRDIGRNLQVFVGVQNLFDQVYFVQTNPSTIGTPRLVNGGVRIRFSGNRKGRTPSRAPRARQRRPWQRGRFRLAVNDAGVDGLARFARSPERTGRRRRSR